MANCEKRTFLHGGHYAFGYIANRYGLKYRSAQAVNPDAEPTASTISELLKLVKSNGLKYVCAEELVSPRISDMIAKETGVKILMLHGAHTISKDDLSGGATFIGLMRKKLENLRIGLQCRYMERVYQCLRFRLIKLLVHIISLSAGLNYFLLK